MNCDWYEFIHPIAVFQIKNRVVVLNLAIV